MNTNYTEYCPIWQTPANSRYFNDGMLLVDSPHAGGEYLIHSHIARCLPEEFRDDRVKALLTSWIIEQRLLGVKYPRITETEIREVPKRQPLSVFERADRLLRYFQRRTQYPGNLFVYSKHMEENSESLMQIMAWSESIRGEEIDFFVDYLCSQGWIERTNLGAYSPYRLTVGGYAHLAELERTIIDSSQVFVAMWFDDSMVPAWEDGIKPAIENTGYTPMRIDQKEHVDRIDDQIIAEIRRSRFVVADFTHGEKGVRGGVYYEAGFSHGLDIPVIFTCQKDILGDIHFDTRQYNHISWENPEELREKLEARIGAVIGQGPVKHKRKAS